MAVFKVFKVFGVVISGSIAYYFYKTRLPMDAWKGLTTIEVIFSFNKLKNLKRYGHLKISSDNFLALFSKPIATNLSDIYLKK